MNFDNKYFAAQIFTADELGNIKKSIKRNLELAGSGKEPEIIFQFSYTALLKTGIYLIAKEGYRVKSQPGHHIKIIEQLSRLSRSQEVLALGDKMRKDRNIDLYSSGLIIEEKEAREYFNFVRVLGKRVLDND